MATNPLEPKLPEIRNNAIRIARARRLAGEPLRLDGLINNVTGFGTSQDKTSYSHFGGFSPLSDQEISALVHGNAMAGRIIDAWPEEMLREAYSTDVGDSAANEWLTEKHRILNVRGHFMDAMRWGRSWGGAAVLLGADDGRPSDQPLRLERVRELRYLYTLDRRYLQPRTYYTDPGSRKLGEPETYSVQAVTGHGMSISQVVHESRLVLFGGAPTGVQEKAALGGWDYSVLQKPYEALLQFDTAWAAVTTMLTDANQAVFKMSGMAEAIAAGEGDALKERMRVVDLYRSLMRAMVIDAGNGTEPAESFERQSVSFADIPNTLEKIIVRLAGASLIPVALLMGTPPSGLNASGDSDFRAFYSRIKSSQTNDLAPRLRRINEILLASKESSFEIPKKHEIKFEALWTLDPLREAQRRQALAVADASYVSAGVYLPEEIALSRSANNGPDEIQITSEARKSRELGIQAGLEDIADPYEEVPLVEETPSDAPSETQEA